MAKIDWRDIKVFEGIDLNDSFVLSWHVDDNELRFAVEVSIWPDSTYYRMPEANEYTCYRPAFLSFLGFRKITGLKQMEEVRPGIDADGRLDYGNFDALVQTAAGYEITGDFGCVVVAGGRLEFHISEDR